MQWLDWPLTWSLSPLNTHLQWAMWSLQRRLVLGWPDLQVGRYIINVMESQIHSDVKLIEHRLTLLWTHSSFLMLIRHALSIAVGKKLNYISALELKLMSFSRVDGQREASCACVAPGSCLDIVTPVNNTIIVITIMLLWIPIATN